jgi:hypothetical protein
LGLLLVPAMLAGRDSDDPNYRNVALAQAAPPNDDFDQATVITSLPFTDSLDTTDATIEPDDPSGDCWQNSHSVWYSFTPTEDIEAHIGTAGSGYDTVLAVWTGVRGALNEVACNDDNEDTSSLQADLIIELSAGVTYFIEVMAFDTDEGGQLEFLLELRPPPPNDDIDSATEIDSLSYYYYVYTVTATTAVDDPTPSCGASDPATQSNSIWYSFVPPNDGAITLSTEDSDYQTVVAVWEGDRGDLSELGCSVAPDDSSLLLVPTTAGDRYWIEVTQYGDPGGGDLVLHLGSALWNGRAMGLRGEYYNNSTLDPPIFLTRYDGRIYFSWWGYGSPADGMDHDAFSVRWTGYVEPEFSEEYTFVTYSDDGVRLWIDGDLLIDNWTIHGTTRDEGTIDLEAYEKYPIMLEYFEGGGDSAIDLIWSSPSTGSEYIQTANLTFIDLDNSTIQADPTEILANGVATSTVTIVAEDTTGTHYQGYPVELQVSGSGNLINGTNVDEGEWLDIGITDATGMISAEIASIVAENKTVRARVGSFELEETASVRFISTEVAELLIFFPGEQPSPGQPPGKSGTPLNAAVGQTYPFNVRIVDDNWNLVENFNGTVSLTSTDPGASLPANLDIVNGQVTGLVTWETEGSQTITATLVEDPVLTDDSTAEVLFETLIVGADETVTLDDNRYPITTLVNAGATSLPYDGSLGFQPGDELLIVNMLGEEIGTYETSYAMFVEGDQIVLSSPLVGSFDGALDKVMVQAVPYFSAATVQTGGILTAHEWDGATGGILSIRAIDLTVESGGEITVEGLGFNPFANGPGAGDGGSHGGWGGLNFTGLPYGSVFEPLTLGSSENYESLGGNSMPGGGIIHLQIRNALQVDGSLDADAHVPPIFISQGGAGGSIWLDAQTILGSGSIRAEGARGLSTSGNLGSGGGGRIATYFENDLFNGTWSAAAGTPGYVGGPGTIFFENTTTGNRKLLVDNLDRVGRQAALTDQATTIWEFDEIELRRNGDLELIDLNDSILLTSDNMSGDGTAQLHLHNDFTFNETDLSAFGLSMREDSRLILPANYTFLSGTLEVHGELEGASSLTISSSGVADGILRLGATGHSIGEVTGTYVFDQIIIEADQKLELASDVGNELGVTLIANSIDIQPGGEITADGLGYAWEAGNPGPGVGGGEQGGGHGGYGGGNGGGLAYGSVLEPDMPGSAGGGDSWDNDPLGQPGGGAVKIIVGDILQVDGVLSSNGIDALYERGGGAGGSLWLILESLSGSGVVRANGGEGYPALGGYAGGGGGGRIAAYIHNDTFTGTWEAVGGGDGNVGGPGTIYLENMTTGYKELLIDNQDLAGPPAVILSDPGTTTWTFDRVELIRDGDLELLDPEDELVLTPVNMAGDDTAQLHLHGFQSYTHPTIRNFGFYVREDATLTLSTELTLGRVKLTNEGAMEGLSTLTLQGTQFISTGTIPELTALTLEANGSENSLAQFGAIGRTGTDPIGTYRIGTVIIDPDQVLELAGDPATGQGVRLISDNVTIAGHLSADGLGYTRDENGPGAPYDLEMGGGAGHGGIGGGKYEGGQPTVQHSNQLHWAVQHIFLVVALSSWR